MNLELDGTGTIAIGQFTDFTSGRIAVSGSDRSFSQLVNASDTDFVIQGAHVDLPLLARLRLGGMTLQSGGTASVPVLWEIDGASFYISEGVTLAVPAATSYTHASTANDQQRSWIVEGPSSRLDLSNVTTITGGTHYNSRLNVEAWSGGVIDLSKVAQIKDPDTGDTRYRAVAMIVEGVGSRLRLNTLNEFADRNAGSTSGNNLWSSVTVRYEGIVELPSTEQAVFTGVDVNLEPRGFLQGSPHIGATSRLRGTGEVHGNVTNDGIVAPAQD